MKEAVFSFLSPKMALCPNPFLFLAIFNFFVLVSLSSSSARTSPAGVDFCNSELLPPLHLLHTNKLTVLLSGFSEARLPLLRSLAISYSTHPAVSSVQILWSNPLTANRTLTQALHPFPVHRNPSASLNSRFLPRPSVLTRAVAIADDDIEIPSDSLSFAFSVFNTQPHRLVGFFPRSHDLDLAAKSWIYTVHPDKYSIVLTKFFIMGVEYLYRYSCGGGEKMRQMREVVDRKRNCEDILMNFVAAERTGAGPVLVEGKGLRDWGDVRNQEQEKEQGEEGERRGSGTGESQQEEEETKPEEDLGNANGKVSIVGLSKRGGHWKTRGDCIREFHKILGKMPLRYSYGKVVAGIREQALCEKGGKLVVCDQQVGD
ncbi:glycosyltransferase family protein 64 C3 [Aristolochia californica]|uniref:glycosyltransferase family protein 64 C3 n=1 Tax=Aristolochia californica TaxID=171875 RepID=UPI0035D91809